MTDTTTSTNNRRSTFVYNELGQVTSANDGLQSYDAAATRTTFASIVNWTGTWGYLPAYEANTSYTGDGAPAKQTVTTRLSDGYSTGTVTTYYVRSTVLGGKVVTELDATGAWKSSTVYAEGMKLAVYKNYGSPPTPVLEWQHMDPVTGNEASSNSGGYSAGFSQLDPLGSDVTFAPDPNVYEEPPYLDPTSVFSTPIENRGMAWGWEGDIALADWGDRIQNTYDTIRAEHYWATNRRGLAIDIISQNPNVGIDVRMTGFGLDGTAAGSIFGSEAAGFLTDLDQAIVAGHLVQEGLYNGGSPNKIAQLANCATLTIPAFENISAAAKSLLSSMEGAENARHNYQIMPVYFAATFLNTAAAAASIGVDFSRARFEEFYMSDKVGPNTENRRLPFGIVVSGAGGILNGRHGNIGAIEINTRNGRSTMDVDLYQPTGVRNILNGNLRRHAGEVRFNNRHNRPTHPGDVARQLAERGVASGVTCK